MKIKTNGVFTVSISFASQPALLAFIANAPRGDVARICKDALRAAAGVDSTVMMALRLRAAEVARGEAAGVDAPPPKKVRKTSLRSLLQNGMQLR